MNFSGRLKQYISGLASRVPKTKQRKKRKNVTSEKPANASTICTSGNARRKLTLSRKEASDVKRNLKKAGLRPICDAESESDNSMCRGSDSDAQSKFLLHLRLLYKSKSQSLPL